MDLDKLRAIAASAKSEIGKAVIGQEDAVDLMLIALFSRGHILLEGVPGTAKTLMAQAFASALGLDCGRIQFTPDLMPGDVIGTNLYNFQSNSFNFVKGPVFTDLLIADEINRTPPKTQAALLQAMQEHEITIDGTTLTLGDMFMVVATENPIEQQGTYPLPEAQLDRFLFKHVLAYPDREAERAIVAGHGKGAAMPDIASFGIAPVLGRADIAAARQNLADLRLAAEIVDYIVDLIRATREFPAFAFGASPRAAAMLAAASRVQAGLQGRDFVIPDDVKFLLAPALRHRVVLAPSAEIEGLTADQAIAQIVDRVPAPR